MSIGTVITAVKYVYLRVSTDTVAEPKKETRKCKKEKIIKTCKRSVTATLYANYKDEDMYTRSCHLSQLCPLPPPSSHTATHPHYKRSVTATLYTNYKDENTYKHSCHPGQLAPHPHLTQPPIPASPSKKADRLKCKLSKTER